MMAKGILPTLGAIGIGAGLMYMMDPEEGKSRRAMLKDKFVHWGHEAEDMVEGKAQHMSNKARGMMAEAKSAMKDMKSDMRSKSSDMSDQPVM